MREFHFSIDRGGTFTDVFAEVPDGKGGTLFRALKLLSEDPSNYSDAPREGIRRILQDVTGTPHLRDVPLDTSRLASIRMGTTVATNALLERKGERTALLVTAGFPDLLHIANQSRPNIFDLKIQTPDNLYERVVEVDEQVILPLGDTPDQRNGRDAARNAELYPPGGRLVTVATGERVCVRKEPDLVALRRDLEGLLASGISSIAVVLKHSAIFPDHELAVGRLAKEMGFKQISLSSVVMPMVKMVPRGFTAAADAYLTPHIMRYIQTFQSGFDAGLSQVQVLFMQSDGGLSSVERFSGHKAILSGPAGGYVGYALTTRWEGQDPAELQVIGFDMGGTSTDVSRFAGTYEHVFETTTAGVTIQAPQLDINTVAAGGGSRLFFRNGLFVVGPESAAAHPGPVCYKKGGYLAITDANLALGRVLPDFFPKIFGPHENEPLDAAGTAAAFAALAEEVNAYETQQGKPPKTVDEIAMGFITVANETMCRPIRALTTMKGYDASAHALACFGGAGGQHACAIARSLGMRTIFVHRFAGILSAVGIHLADIVQEAQEPCASSLSQDGQGNEQVLRQLDDKLDRLEAGVREQLLQQGFETSHVRVERFLNLRYRGTDVAVMTRRPDDGNYVAAFEAAYVREFGFKLDRDLIVDDVRVRGTGSSRPLPSDEGKGVLSDPGPLPEPVVVTSAYFEAGGRQGTPVFELSSVRAGHRLHGPAILIDSISTIVVEPGWNATITADHNVRMDAAAAEEAAPASLPAPASASAPASAPAPAPAPAAAPAADSAGSVPPADGVGGVEGVAGVGAAIACDPIQLAIFSHRFMGIAEQMGRTLQRTSISVNIKERLDFSCALFGPDGSLVANAPHLPVHLGAMSEAVRFQVRYYTEGPGRDQGLHEGDVLLSNHPQLAGGSHLPDITAITPVFSGGRIVFFVASRGHHADIGGISPGSMPPHSKLLVEEGAAIVSFKVVEKGVFQEEALSRLLLAPGELASSIPGMSGTRNLADNLSDIRAQVAANTRGIQLVADLIAEYGLVVVQAYMEHIQRNAEAAVREMLTAFSLAQGLPERGTVHAHDAMDDGTRIALSVTIDRRDGSALFDFEGTGPEVYGNCNAPPAVAYSAIIYAMRCMVTRDIPLNQGCLAPIRVRIPPACLLNPSPEAAVVGGNVLTSQRVTDVVLRAFHAAAASQGCMNNLTFGDEGMGYYETIAGGAGAGPGWHGRSGVHTHMTNTRITDPEILERRYPVVLRCFRLRPGSGGAGRWRGGDGVVRELEALRPIDAGILSERRALRPYGLKGGGDAESGINLLIRASGRVVNLGGKATVRLQAGDRLQINTPGGGGFGGHAAAAGSNMARDGGDGASGCVQAPPAPELRGSVHEYRRLQETA